LTAVHTFCVLHNLKIGIGFIHACELGGEVVLQFQCEQPLLEVSGLTRSQKDARPPDDFQRLRVYDGLIIFLLFEFMNLLSRLIMSCHLELSPVQRATDPGPAALMHGCKAPAPLPALVDSLTSAQQKFSYIFDM